ncbi:MAG: 3-hydroxybutyryl-CoA dehydrogenase [Ignavibacteriae bacterium]|nr:3-hydroxybutyryl-CoA dehydrogenase [Ignavibacteriota bacterium]
MKTIGIVGAGIMGRGIAYLAALSGFDILLHDLSEDILKQAMQRISSDLRKGVEKGKITSQQASEVSSKLHPRTSLDDFKECEIVIEAIIESLEIKKETFKKLDEMCPPQTILATNTSSLSVTSIASSVGEPTRVVGMHFFNPPYVMKLVEVVHGHQTSERTLQRTVELARQLGRTPVVVKDTPGFIVNRIARPFYGEALRLLGEGVASVEDIDRIVKLEGGFTMGPFELMDLIGTDVNLAVTKSIYERTFGEPRYRPHIIQQTMVDAGLWGRKTKRGFYTYDS